MDYKVLYRKYRPDCFENIVGQNYTISMLKNAVINNKLSHAYLFTGPRGTGKTSTAKVFAKTINCENRVNGEACGKCSSCLNFAHSSDIIEIDAASNNGVDDIRELINNVKIAPTFSKYKIYIIDEVHMMTQSAFNALLLTLEEPPAHAIFIMATTNVESVPITILSRCQRFNFKKIDFETIKNQLIKICDNEKIKITDEAVNEITYLSEGGLRDALSLLDQLSSENEEITLDNILANYGSISSLFIKNLIDSIEKNDAEKIIQAMNELENSSSDYKVFIKKLVNELIKKAIQIKQNLVKTSLSYENIKNLILDLNDCFNKISIHINPYSLIQVILLQYVNSKNIETNLKDNDNLSNITNDKSNNKEKSNDNNNLNINKLDETVQNNTEVLSYTEEFNEYLNELKSVRINNCFATAQKNILNTYQEKLENRKDLGNLQSLLIDAKIVAAGSDIVLFATSLASTADLINHHMEQIEEHLSTILGVNDLKIIAVSNEEWLKNKQEYIQNLKNGVKYEVIDESGIQELKPTISDSQLEEFVEEMFADNKIEIIEGE